MERTHAGTALKELQSERGTHWDWKERCGDEGRVVLVLFFLSHNPGILFN